MARGGGGPRGGGWCRRRTCDVWPEEYRGERWKSVYAILFAGRCQLCAYSCPLPDRGSFWTSGWAWPGGCCARTIRTAGRTAGGAPDRHLPELQSEELAASPKQTRQKRSLREKEGAWRRGSTHSAGPWTVRYVDAADYEELKKYRWYASHHGPTIYARCGKRARTRICTG
jgi:hypothetical protein